MLLQPKEFRKFFKQQAVSRSKKDPVKATTECQCT